MNDLKRFTKTKYMEQDQYEEIKKAHMPTLRVNI